MNEFQLNILDNYKNPNNYGGPAFNSNAYASQGNITCGDKIEVFLMLDNVILKDVSFKAEGCSISIGAFSIISEELKNKSIKEILSLDYENFIKPLIGLDLTPTRIRCATLGLDAVQKALMNPKSSV